MMKALISTRYGSPDVLEFKEIDKPVPNEDQVLVKVHAASINAADLQLLKADPFIIRLMVGGLFNPKIKILGADMAGQVEAVGKNVTQFRPGDEVFGDLFPCGCGALAEYVLVPENLLVLKPANLTFEEAAAVPLAAVTALQGLRDKGGIRPGQKVLINGASGGVGTFAIQMARYYGAEVTAVCSTHNLELALSLGANHVLDYTQQDFTRSGKQYDLILAVNGYHSLFDYRRALSPNGIFVSAGGSMAQLIQLLFLGPWMSLGRAQKMGNLSAHTNKLDLLFIKELLETGKVAPFIDRRYPLSEAADAFRYLEQGHARGKVVIVMDDKQEAALEGCRCVPNYMENKSLNQALRVD